ncbi:site-specific integrase [Enterococcus wangshanyuanii]|uniref:Site-specific integrase n=1 Tax=Enterococcus wangshanyuanii TaxID=2005703 RepID=A0ABQ1PUG3_9ENTE|nr:site-specific integrase [Enterococcus wangshanyuanii]GGD04013.1 site-specific integrase [Enterococcus wangshanyuanii]
MATFKQYKLKDGSKKWLFKTYLGIDPVTGKQITTTRRGFRTNKEAILAEKMLQHEFIEEGFNRKGSSTFEDAYKMWFDSYKNTVKETTSMKTEMHFDKHILPIFGSLLIDKIDMKLCQKSVNKWAEQFEMFGLLMQYTSKVFDYAIHLEMISSNPFRSVIKPRKKKSSEKKLKYYNTSELKQVMEYLKNKVDNKTTSSRLKQYYNEFDLAMFRLLAFSGIRVGEALALSFSDFDFSSNTLEITKTMSDSKNGHVISTPKTESSRRTIMLDEATMLIIKKWQLRQKEYLFANKIKSNGMVFIGFDGSTMIRQDVYQRSKRLSKAVGLHTIGSHGYRHSHASMLFEAGASMKEAQERLGHSSIEMTMNVYTHVTNETKKKTVEKIVNYVNF